MIYCEGDTEYNYFDAMRKMPNVEISIQAINMHGGGYRNFLTEIRKSGQYGKIATFIIIDGDRAEKNFQEKKKLDELIDYCEMQNEKIYDFLHKDSRHHKIMLEKIKSQKKLIENEYEKKSVIITVTETKIDWDLIGQKSTNINEIFEILEV